jgi:hypothetical protein
VTVFAGEMAGEAFEAFLGGLPNLDGPGPIEFRNVGAGDASESIVISLDGEDPESALQEAEAGYDLVFFNIVLLGEAFFLPFPFNTPYIRSA